MFIPNDLFSFLCTLGFGVRSLTFEDFEIACEKFGFKYFLVDEKLIDEGFTYPRHRHGKKYKIIILRRTLFSIVLTEVAWHEFGHAYFEHYGLRCFVRGSEEKAEKQMNDFALVCQIPTLWMRTKTKNEILDEGFTKEQYNQRLEIFNSTGM